jgi:hypothetical protein
MLFETIARMFGVLAAAAPLIAITGCGTTDVARAQPDPQPTETITDAPGAVVAVRPDAGWWGIVPDSDRGTRYAPDRLPDEFKVDGLRVVFSGRVRPVDPNVRMWGTPIDLTNIRRE